MDVNCRRVTGLLSYQALDGELDLLRTGRQNNTNHQCSVTVSKFENLKLKILALILKDFCNKTPLFKICIKNIIVFQHF